MLEYKLKLDSFLSESKSKLDISNYTIDQLVKSKDNQLSIIQSLKKNIELHTTASSFLQSIIESVCQKNIRKIEDFVNLSLKNIFNDQEITFRIDKSIKRNVNVYSFVLYKDGVEGSINSFGGGILCVVSLVLKILFIKLTKSFNLLVLDESLSFLSEGYLENCSKYIKTMTTDFNLNLILVTHQSKFKYYADNIYLAESLQNKTQFKKIIESLE